MEDARLHSPWPVSQWMTRGSKGRTFHAEETVLPTNGGMKEHGVLKEMKDEVFMGK